LKNPAAGGGRWVEVQPARFVSWVDEFGRRHGGAGPARADEESRVITITAADGAIAECHPPFPPFPPMVAMVAITARSGSPIDTEAITARSGRLLDGAWAEQIARHTLAERTVGVLLARLGGFAVGVFAGSPPRLTVSKTGSRPVHGRSAAGGWSQQRFARRREKQASEALRAAADAAAHVFADVRLDAIVLGGDRRAIATLAEDPRLKDYLRKADDRFLTVPDPGLAVLRDTPRAFLAIRVRIIELPAAVSQADRDGLFAGPELRSRSRRHTHDASWCWRVLCAQWGASVLSLSLRD
jgi:hypothetical protein